MQHGAVHERDHSGLVPSAHMPPLQRLQVHVSVQVLMDYAIPFPGVFIEVGGVPVVLVELVVGEEGQVRVEVGDELECQHKHHVVDHQNRQVPGGESFVDTDLIVEETNQRLQDPVEDFVDDTLNKGIMQLGNRQ